MEKTKRLTLRDMRSMTKEELIASLMESERKVGRLEAKAYSLNKRLLAARAKIERQLEVIRKFGVERFVTKSETLPESPINEAEACLDASDKAERSAPKAKRGRKKGSRNFEGWDLEARSRENPVVYDRIGEACPSCGGELVEFGRDEYFEISLMPERVIVTKHIRKKMRCKACGAIAGALSDAPFYHSPISASFAASVVEKKLELGVPLDRQARKMTDLGLPTTTQLLSETFLRAADLLKPVWDGVVSALSSTKCGVINADETPVKVLDERKEGRLVGMKKGKEGIFGPIVQIGYLVDEWGLLVGLLVFKGSSSEQPSLQEQIARIFGPSKLKDTVICTDAGLCSVRNKRYCEVNFKGYITTQPLSRKKVPDFIREWAVDEPFEDGGKAVTRKEIIERYGEALKTDPEAAKAMLGKTYFKSRWYMTTASVDYLGRETLDGLKGIDDGDRGKTTLSRADVNSLDKARKGKPRKVTFEQRLVVSFNLKYYLSQLADLEAERAKAEGAIAAKTDVSGAPRRDFKRFLDVRKVTEKGEIVEELGVSFLQDEYDYELSLCGVYCQATNLSDGAREIYGSARNRWIVEYAFRTAKTSLGMGTVYLQTAKHIIGHFELCFLAQMMLRVLTYKLYGKIGHGSDKLGKIDPDDESRITQDAVLDELAGMRSSVEKDDKGELCLVARCNKNDMNKLFAETFRMSLTTQVRKYEDISKFLK